MENYTLIDFILAIFSVFFVFGLIAMMLQKKVKKAEEFQAVDCDREGQRIKRLAQKKMREKIQPDLEKFDVAIKEFVDELKKSGWRYFSIETGSFLCPPVVYKKACGLGNKLAIKWTEVFSAWLYNSEVKLCLKYRSTVSPSRQYLDDAIEFGRLVLRAEEQESGKFIIKATIQGEEVQPFFHTGLGKRVSFSQDLKVFLMMEVENLRDKYRQVIDRLPGINV